MSKIKFLSILNATSIHQGGGRSILNEFNKIKFDKVYFDPRLKNRLVNSYLYKLYLEFILLFKSNKNTKIVYLSGTPPIFKSNSYIFCCFQNCNIFFFCHHNLFHWFFSKDFFRYLYFCIFKNNVDLWIVFSDYAKNLLLKNNIKEYKIKLLNLYTPFTKKKKNKKKIFDFIYPASLLPHKNHINLIKALIILANKGLYPKILLTLNKNEILTSGFLKFIDQFKLKVTFKYFHNSINKGYECSKALIYPSLRETVGLPLLEASNNGLYILAANRFYSKQFIKPLYIFDPLNPKNIAHKMRKFLIEKNFLTKTKLINHNINYLTIKKAKKLFL